MNRFKMGVSVLAVAVFAGLLPAQDANPEKKVALPEVKVPVVKQAPKIDGTLDDPAWKQAATFDTFKLANGDASKAKTKLYVMQDDKNLYVAVECFDSEKALQDLVAKVKDHDGELWTDDDVELFIDPSNKRDQYYQIIVNSKNVTFDATQSGEGGKDMDDTWNPKYQSATKVGKESWVAEFALPFAIFDKTKNFDGTWAFNVFRNQVSGEGSYMSPVGEGGGAHQPAKFGKLTGMTAKPAEAASTSAPASAPAADGTVR